MESKDSILFIDFFRDSCPDTAGNALLMDFADFAGGSLHLQRLYVFAFLPWQCQIASAGFQRVRMNIHPMGKSVKRNFKKIWEKVTFFS